MSVPVERPEDLDIASSRNSQSELAVGSCAPGALLEIDNYDACEHGGIFLDTAAMERLRDHLIAVLAYDASLRESK